jgi:hypothetical protein
MIGKINTKLNDLKKIQHTLEINDKIDLNNNLDITSFSEELYPSMVI